MEMEAENKDVNKSSHTVFFEGSEGVRSKTSTRIFYDAQVSVIKKQLGNLEKIRADLGLSQRKICQLLMVDPSAWTRWNREGEEAPPHIWRSLQWYMTLQEKIPGLTPQYFIGKDPQILHEKALAKIDEEVQHLKSSFQEQQGRLLKDLRFYRVFNYVLIGITLLITALFVFLRRIS